MEIVTDVKKWKQSWKHDHSHLVRHMSFSLNPSKTWVQVASAPAKPISSSPPQTACLSSSVKTTPDKGVVCLETTPICTQTTCVGGVHNDNSGRMLPIGYAPKPGGLRHEWDWSHDETDDMDPWKTRYVYFIVFIKKQCIFITFLY